MRKKWMTLLLILVMVVQILSGCAKKEIPLPDTIRFMNATYSVITARNKGNYNIVGGYDAKESQNATLIQGLLKNSWSVTDTVTAKETVDWIVSEGHNLEVLQSYKDNGMDEFTRSDLETILVEPDFTPEMRTSYLCIYDSVQKFGDNAILAWDLSRAEQLLGWYYVAGYYTYEEAMDKSLEIAKILQENYSSWDEMMESYFLGYQYWAEESKEDSETEAYSRYKLYEQLKADEKGPFAIDWNTQLQKEW